MRMLIVVAIAALCTLSVVADQKPPTQQFFDEVARVGHPAPHFRANAVIDGKITTLDLDDFKGKWVVLLFYPLDFTFVCPTELIAFSDAIPTFHNLNAEVIGASIDSEFTHLSWSNTPRKQGGLGGLAYPLISDVTRSIAASYGALYMETGHTLRALYLIDPTQKIRSIIMNDLPVGRSVEEVIRLLQAFQHVEEHGELCPANWKPGADTMQEDYYKSKEYFAKIFKDVE